MTDRTAKNETLRRDLETDLSESKKRLRAIGFSGDGKLTHGKVTELAKKLSSVCLFFIIFKNAPN